MMEILSQFSALVIFIWFGLSVAYWLYVIYALFTNDRDFMHILRINNMLQFILAILVPFLYILYVVICMGIVLVKNFRNIFKR